MRLSLACSPGSVRAPPNNPNRIQTLRFPISLPLSALGAERGFMAALSFLCAGIGVGRLAGGIFVRPQDCLLGVGFPLIEIAALHIVELHLQNARLLPLAVRPNARSPTIVLMVFLRSQSASLSWSRLFVPSTAAWSTC